MPLAWRLLKKPWSQIPGIPDTEKAELELDVADVVADDSTKHPCDSLLEIQMEDLKAWRAVSKYNTDADWVFASDRKKGAAPLWSNTILDRKVRPLAAKLGIKKNIGWHTFRRTFTSLLTKNKENVSIVQQLARHANPTTTFALYAQAVPEDIRSAQGKIVEMDRNAPLPAVPETQEASVGA